MALFDDLAKRFGAAASAAGSLFGSVAAALRGLFPGRGRKVDPASVPSFPTSTSPAFTPTPDALIPEDLEEGFLDDVMFVFFAEPYDTFASSNVVSFQYHREDRKLTVGYKGRRSAADVAYYEYHPVSESEAKDAFLAVSKGGWVWDKLRIRGTQSGHHKGYVFLSGPSVWQPNPGFGIWGPGKRRP